VQLFWTKVVIVFRHLNWIKSWLFIKIQFSEHYYLSEHGCYYVQEFYSCDHNMLKVDPHTERMGGKY
jgi:hypothetical protein